MLRKTAIVSFLPTDSLAIQYPLFCSPPKTSHSKPASDQFSCPFKLPNQCVNYYCAPSYLQNSLRNRIWTEHRDTLQFCGIWQFVEVHASAKALKTITIFSHVLHSSTASLHRWTSQLPFIFVIISFTTPTLVFLYRLSPHLNASLASPTLLQTFCFRPMSKIFPFRRQFFPNFWPHYRSFGSLLLKFYPEARAKLDLRHRLLLAKVKPA